MAIKGVQEAGITGTFFPDDTIAISPKIRPQSLAYQNPAMAVPLYDSTLFFLDSRLGFVYK